ncbi:hypothetical protein [Streptomyces sp. NBC_01497]|uniref:hypothetical protein n=1 Tax=Streptomyces sp. NBC_01497 TaxID=2903885 RepID=UPI002E31B9D4|nr:hypothetical protein [Streptomyces sp. NBC_01497]
MMPRVECPSCNRLIAAAPVSGRPGMGRIFRHDEPGVRRERSGSLVSCPGSLDVVTLPDPGMQLDLFGEAEEQQEHDDPVLF